MKYPSGTHLKLKSRGITFVHKIHFIGPIDLKICIGNGNPTVLCCTKFLINLMSAQKVMAKRVFPRFGFEIPYLIVQHTPTVKHALLIKYFHTKIYILTHLNANIFVQTTIPILFHVNLFKSKVWSICVSGSIFDTIPFSSQSQRPGTSQNCANKYQYIATGTKIKYSFDSL